MVKRKHQHSPGATRGGGVLVVDDHPETLEIISLQLGALNVAVQTAMSGEAAMKVLKGEKRPDVVITDYSMPGMKGAELCRRIRADASLASTYVLMLTGYEEEDGQQKIGRGADEYLTKPYSAHVLRASVRSGLRAQAHRRVLARRERRHAIEWLTNVVAHEFNNPLTAAQASLHCAQLIANDTNPEPQDAIELREMLDEVHTQLERLSQATRRLNASGIYLQTSTSALVDINELVKKIEDELGSDLKDRLSVGIEEHSLDMAVFDDTLLLSAVVPLLLAAGAQCMGEIRVSVHFDDSRVAILAELEKAPDRDPENILEPRLEATGVGPATFAPGLSALETSFARYGGQIFARPIETRWRFGLTLPQNDALLRAG